MADCRAARLLREVVDCEPESLPAYNDEEVRLVVEECHEHYALMREIFGDLEKDGAPGPTPSAADDPENRAPPLASTPAAFAGGADAAAAVVCHHAAILRSKRLLLTYLSERLERLKALRWRHAVLPERVAGGLSPSEAAFFADYDRLLAATTGPAGLACDVTLADRPPAAAGDVMVRCVADGGDVAFSSGTFRLDAGSVHTLPRAEAEPLLREGVLVEVTDGAREQQEI